MGNIRAERTRQIQVAPVWETFGAERARQIQVAPVWETFGLREKDRFRWIL